jgi:DNA-binding MarR family transcriptional regulator
MRQDHTPARTRLSKIEAERGRNLRQLLLRASRIVNRHVVEELQARGYTGIRATHTTLLSNMDLAGGTVTRVADRAGVTKQAMGRLAAELQREGYLTVADEPHDARVKVLRLTKKGRRLMLDSLKVMAELESGYATAIGRTRFAGLRTSLRGFIEAHD